MKRRVYTLLCVLLATFLCLPITGFAADQQIFTLRVGYWPGYGLSEDENGKLSGYLYDYMHEIAKINGWKVTFISCEWSEGLQMLESGELDTFGPLQKTPEREKLYDYPEFRMGYEYGALYVKNDNNRIFYDDLNSINGKILGTVDDNYYTKVLQDYCAENGITIQTKIIKDVSGLNQAFNTGEVDLRASGSMLSPADAKVVLRFGTEDFYCPTTKGNSVVLNGLNFALKEIQREKTYYDAELYNKYYTQNSIEKKAFTSDETDFILTAPVLRIGYEATGKPIEFYDEESQSAKGISIDILQAISEYSGLKFEFVKTDSVEQAYQMMSNGELQLLSGLVGSENFEELYQLLPTDSFIQNTLVFITKYGSSFDNGNSVLALPKKWVGIQNHMKIYYPQLEIAAYDDVEACLKAVQSGQAKLTVLNAYATEKIMKEHRYHDLTVNNMKYGITTLCLGTMEDANPLLRSILNKSIAALDVNIRNQSIYQHTIGTPYIPPVSEVLRYNLPVIFIGVIVFFVFFLIITFHSRKKLNSIAYYDPLTGEMNLTCFRIEAQKMMNHTNQIHAIMALDIEKFKSINDLYGYEFGDKILVLMAKALRESILSNTILCRESADNFIIFFDYVDEAWMAERFGIIVENISNMIRAQLSNCKIVISGGICIIEPNNHNIITMIDRANIAKKQVKGFHESRFQYYQPIMYDQIKNAMNIESHMSEAILNEEFQVYLQPKIELATNRIAGAEALVRWEHPVQGMIQPSAFIPLFEANGFIVNLDFYMMEQVCKLLERWKKEGRPLCTISVNLSRRHLFEPDTAQKLCSIISNYSIEPRFIEIELTESAFDNCNVPSIRALFDELHGCGFTLSVDDFGAGYSSLSLLKDLPIDALKIDKSFFDCRQNCKTEKIDILLESIISLSQRLNIKTISEGVETEQQVNLLMQLGCDLVQGYYFAKPMPVAQFEVLLESQDLIGASI